VRELICFCFSRFVIPNVRAVKILFFASMTHELILTSVSQGLEPDTSGYCIVAEDRQIPRYLAKRLEALSEYQHHLPVPFTPEESRFYPVAYSHLIFPGHNTIWHTLSRVADAGTDYRFQPNQLAHHIALTQNELVQEGPAWLLSLPGFHLTDWQTPSVRFANGRIIPTLTLPPNLARSQRIAEERRWTDPRKMILFVPDNEDQEIYRIYENNTSQNPNQPFCPFWQELTGDAGWAGILAETVQTGQQAVLVFQPGMNILPLFFEAISILPAELQWKGTFSTYYFKDLPEHTACQWKAVLAGSPIAEQLLKNNDHLILDLTKPLGMIPAGKYVEFARTGSEETLPKNEIPENLFHSEKSFDKESSVPVENLFQPADSPLNPPISPKPPEFDAPLKTDSDHPATINKPPIIISETLRIQTKVPIQQNLFSSILNMKSRGQFYLLYGATFLILLALLILVLDQVTNLGLIRLFQENDKTNPKTVAGSSVPPKNAKTKEEENALQNKKDTVTLEEEKKIKQKEEQQKQQEQNQINALRIRQKQLQDRANTIRSEIVEQKKQIQINLNEYLSEHIFSTPLAMSVPQFQEDHVNPPELKTFAELIDLYPFGLALELQYVPLLDIPNVRVETRKHTFFRDIDEKEVRDNSNNKKTKNKISGNEKESLTPEDEKTSENSEASESSVTEWQVPVTDRFEWLVLAVDTDTLQETPMFDLKLTEQGLSVEWRIEGMETQHLYDTLAASFGFLRVFTEGNHDKTKIQSIPFFDPKIQKPLFLMEHFAESKQAEYSVATPLTAEPWRSFFGTTKIPFAFRLDVTVRPDNPETLQSGGIKSVNVKEPNLPSEFFVEFETEVESKKTVATGSDTYLPVTISFEGAAELERVVWHDRSGHQTDLLKQEQETGNATVETMKKELDTIKKEILVAGSAVTLEQRRKRNELQAEITKLENRNKEITDILNKIPLAREKIVKNEQLRFDYGIYLIPFRNEVKESTNTADPIDRLRKEEALLIMKTETPQQE
jgi:hypothetical protein